MYIIAIAIDLTAKERSTAGPSIMGNSTPRFAFPLYNRNMSPGIRLLKPERGSRV
jgi:hypothetical protein